VVPLVLGGVLLAMMVGIAVFLTPITGRAAGAGDRVGMVAFGVGAAWLLVRLASVRADAGPAGLVVRNIARTRTVAWAEVVSVRFGPDRPWVQLDLADGETLAVMAVQRADGAHAQAEARRLASLVARYSATPRDD
jgi:hypothetical protein